MRLKFILAIAMVLVGCGNKAKTTAGQPSLQETQRWMHDFVADRGAGATYDGSGCSGVVTWLEKDGSPYYTFSFSFGDLDPNTATSVHTVVSPPVLQNMWRAMAVTTNNLKKIAVYNHQTEQHTQDSVIEGINFRSRGCRPFCQGSPSRHSALWWEAIAILITLLLFSSGDLE